MRRIETIAEVRRHLADNEQRVKGLQNQIRNVKQQNYRAVLLEDLEVYKNNVKFFSGRLEHLKAVERNRLEAELEAAKMRLRKVLYLIDFEETGLTDYVFLVEEAGDIGTRIKALELRLNEKDKNH